MPRNRNVVVFASAAYAVADARESDWIDNPDHNSAYIVVDCTVDAASGSMVATIEGYDPTSAKAYVVATMGAVASVSTMVDLVGSKVAAAEDDGAGVTLCHDLPLPRKWRVVMTHADTDSLTYSVAACYVNG